MGCCLSECGHQDIFALIPIPKAPGPTWQPTLKLNGSYKTSSPRGLPDYPQLRLVLLRVKDAARRVYTDFLPLLVKLFGEALHGLDLPLHAFFMPRT